VERVSGTEGHYNSNEWTRETRRKGSLSIQCLPSMNITGDIYRWRYASHVSLLFYPLTTVIFSEYSRTHTWFPYYSMGAVQLRKAHNPRRSSSPWSTKTTGPTDYSLPWCWRRPVFACLRVPTRRIAKTGHLRACSWRRLQCSWCLVFAFLPEDKRRRATSVLAVGIGLSPWLPVFAHLRRPDRRWCPQQ